MKLTKLLSCIALLSASSVFDLGAQTTGTSTLSLTIPAEASITITTPATNLTAGSAFAPYTGATSFSFSIRTSATGGSGTIQLKITSDFTPAGGPSVAGPPSAGDALTYTCNSSMGTACSAARPQAPRLRLP